MLTLQVVEIYIFCSNVVNNDAADLAQLADFQQGK